MTNINGAYETSLSKLSDHDWNVLSNRWCRGISWYVTKLGPKWIANPAFGNSPLFKTKREAGEYVDNLVSAESRWRNARRMAA